jgi:hypothetical protein
MSGVKTEITSSLFSRRSWYRKRLKSGLSEFSNIVPIFSTVRKHSVAIATRRFLGGNDLQNRAKPFSGEYQQRLLKTGNAISDALPYSSSSFLVPSPSFVQPSELSASTPGPAALTQAALCSHALSTLCEPPLPYTRGRTSAHITFTFQARVH